MSTTTRSLRLAALGAVIAVTSIACGGTPGPSPAASTAAGQAVAAAPESSGQGPAPSLEPGLPHLQGQPGPDGRGRRLRAVRDADHALDRQDAGPDWVKPGRRP